MKVEKKEEKKSKENEQLQGIPHGSSESFKRDDENTAFPLSPFCNIFLEKSGVEGNKATIFLH